MTADNPRTLVLMRHAAAENPGRWSDHDRPLTPGGRADAAAAGAWLSGRVPAFATVFCSTAVRARETFAATGVTAPVRYVDELYGGGIEDILGVVSLAPADAAAVLVVGHAPTIPATAHDLVTIAQLAAAERAAGPGDARPTGAGTDDLRSFSACALAVLTLTCGWDELAEHGAALEQVRHPHR